MVYNSICCTILNRSNIYPHSLLQLTIGRMYASTSCGFLFRYDNALKVSITYGNYNKHFKHFIVETSTVHTCQCMLLLGKQSIVVTIFCCAYNSSITLLSGQILDNSVLQNQNPTEIFELLLLLFSPEEKRQNFLLQYVEKMVSSA